MSGSGSQDEIGVERSYKTWEDEDVSEDKPYSIGSMMSVIQSRNMSIGQSENNDSR